MAQPFVGRRHVGLPPPVPASPRWPSAAAPLASNDPKHLVWVWQWNADAEPQVVAPKLRDNGLAVAMKTHDGLEWMSKYDKSKYAVSGPAQVATLARYFEDAGVPFHAWAVVKNEDKMRKRAWPWRLQSGRPQLILDVEPGTASGWAPPGRALAYGRSSSAWPQSKISHNRRAAVDAQAAAERIRLVLGRDPAAELRAHVQYSANYEKFAQAGYPVPQEA